MNANVIEPGAASQVEYVGAAGSLLAAKQICAGLLHGQQPSAVRPEPTATAGQSTAQAVAVLAASGFRHKVTVLQKLLPSSATCRAAAAPGAESAPKTLACSLRWPLIHAAASATGWLLLAA